MNEQTVTVNVTFKVIPGPSFNPKDLETLLVRVLDNAEEEGVFAAFDNEETDICETISQLAPKSALPEGVDVANCPEEQNDKVVALVNQMFQMLKDLDEGYPWRELGVEMDTLRKEAQAAGIQIFDDLGE